MNSLLSKSNIENGGLTILWLTTSIITMVALNLVDFSNKFHANFSFYTANNFSYFSCCVYNYNLSNQNMTGGTIKIHIALVYHVFKNSCSTKFFEKLKNKT